MTGPLKNAKIRTNWLINGKKCLDLGLRILFRAPAWLLFDTYDLRYIIMILAIGIQIQSHAPVPRPENMREAFTKDQKSAANNIALKRTALQAALDQNKDFFLACVWWAVDLSQFPDKKTSGFGFQEIFNCNFFDSPKFFIRVILDQRNCIVYKPISFTRLRVNDHHEVKGEC